QELRQSSELADAIGRLLKQNETRAAALMLIGAAERTDSVARVVAIVNDVHEAEINRTTAVRTLGVLPSPEAVTALQDCLNFDPPVLNDLVLEGLGQQVRQSPKRPSTQAALKALQNLALYGGHDGLLRQPAAAALAGSRAGTIWLLEMHDKKQLA